MPEQPTRVSMSPADATERRVSGIVLGGFLAARGLTRCPACDETVPADYRDCDEGACPVRAGEDD